MKHQIKSWFQYLKVRCLIGAAQRYLAVMVIFSAMTIAVTTIERLKENIMLLIVCTTGMLYYFILYIKERRFYSKFKAYNYYEVKILTGTIHMRIMDLYHQFAGKTDEEVKSLLIEYSYKDFVDIFKDYKESISSSRAIQTHKSFIRPFMMALRDSGLVSYMDSDLERYLTETTESDGIDPEECFLSELNGYCVKLKYIGCVQNKILALRYPITRKSKKYLHKFSTSVPYFEVTVIRF